MDKVEQRIVVYAPVGKDARLIEDVLRYAQLECEICSALPQVVPQLGHGAAALFVIEEAFNADFLAELTSFLSGQPAWSDLPVLVLSKQGLDSSAVRTVFEQVGNVTLLERPVRRATLLSAALSARRARQRQYQMREVDRRKDEFLAILGHELRNPLAPIRTAMDVLNTIPDSSPRLRHITQVVERQVKHLTRLVDDLLDVARITNDKVALKCEWVSLDTVLEHAVELCRPQLLAGGQRLDVRQPPGSVLLSGDRARLVQSLANVLGNAIKFSPPGAPVELRAEVDGGDIVLSVRDHGPGLEPEARARIFELFVQGQAGRVHALGGLGIGLSLAQRFTRMHGGTVQVHSGGQGQGCEFVLRMPIVVADRRRRPRPERRAAADDAEGPLRVMVVDDNVDGAEMLQVMLEMDGYLVGKAHDGQGAIALAERFHPHVALMDIGLPDMQGYEAARRIHALRADDDTVFIAMTGWGHEEARRLAAEAGIQHYLVKPVDLNMLRQQLSDIRSRVAPQAG
ncbi:response regulator [Pseudoduganella sp. DS3]|uniref:histidine kinase n=1 Tax=Pseudoduganella guangdongensis TaxID=2692179 RepID=A0A6N9HIP7_9BURK|nr:hybrid sensor histidine kinase/response regulator [Pseudoduganella guangdongensis]MYN03370.1 response regulator [Pseudoduganella guangdongensis]